VAPAINISSALLMIVRVMILRRPPILPRSRAAASQAKGPSVISSRSISVRVLMEIRLQLTHTATNIIKVSAFNLKG
ncbi:hypothetical protein, partial [Klebsiella pneumoniae]|uniref:hypothetical protein n=1 Tax=Klebsiella pneumoniae TaxID=573 RepID=UPI003F7B2D40